jgi:MFS family permease
LTRRNGSAFAAIACIAIVGVGLSLAMALLAIRLAAAGFSSRAIGFNAAAGGLASLVGAPLAPLLAARVGVRRALLLALAIGAASLAGFAATSAYWAWFALRIGFGFALTVLFVLSEYWIGTVTAPARRGLVIGFYATSLGLGFAAGPLLLAAVGAEGVTPFAVAIGLMGLAALPLLPARLDVPGLARQGRLPLLAVLKRAPAAATAGLVQGALEVTALGLLPVYAVLGGATPEAAARFLGLYAIGGVVLQVPLGLLSDRMDRRRLLLCLALAGLLCTALLPFAARLGPLAFGAGLVVWGGLVTGFYPVGLAHLAARFKDGDLARANAGFVMLYALGMLVGAPFAGLGMDALPPNGFFLAVALMLAAYAGLVAARMRKDAAPLAGNDENASGTGPRRSRA